MSQKQTALNILTLSSVGELEVLVCELLPVDALASSSISSCEVSALITKQLVRNNKFTYLYTMPILNFSRDIPDLV